MVGMTKGQRQDFIREIKKSRNRYISLLAIVLLGVAFFSGIRSSEPAMKQTVDSYLDGQNFMDIRILSTLGMTEDDREAIEKVRGVACAEGMYSADVLTDVDETQKVMNVLSVPEDIGQMYVEEGRLPLKSGECLLDSQFASSNDYEIGDKITVYSGTDEDISETLNTDTFTIVGLGSDPYYLTYERGTSSIGNGTQAGFMAVQKVDFVTDVYTQIYVTLDGAKDMDCYSDEYADLVSEMQEALEAISGERCDIRYEEVRGAALEQVEEAESQLADAEQELTDGWQQWQDGYDEWLEGESQYEEGLSEWQENSDLVASGKEQLAAGQEQFNQSENAYEEARIQVVVLETVLNVARQGYEAEEDLYTELQTELALTQFSSEEEFKEWMQEKGLLPEETTGETPTEAPEIVPEETTGPEESASAEETSPSQENTESEETSSSQENIEPEETSPSSEEMEGTETSAAPEITESAETSTAPEGTEAAETSAAPEITVGAETSAAPEGTEAAETSGAPEGTESAETGATLEITESAETGAALEITEAVETDAAPEITEAAETSETDAVLDGTESEETKVFLVKNETEKTVKSAVSPASFFTNKEKVFLNELPAENASFASGLLYEADSNLPEEDEQLLYQSVENGIETEQSDESGTEIEQISQSGIETEQSGASGTETEQISQNGIETEQSDESGTETEQTGSGNPDVIQTDPIIPDSTGSDSEPDSEETNPLNEISQGLEEAGDSLNEAMGDIQDAIDGVNEGTELSMSDVYAAMQLGTQQMLTTFRTYLDQQSAMLDDYTQQAASARVQINAAGTQIQAAKLELYEKEIELQMADAQLESAKTTLDSSKEQLDDAWDVLEENRQKLEDGQAEFDEKNAEAKEELADARKQIDEIEYPEWYVLDRNTIQAYVEFGQDAESIGALSRIFPTIFFLVAALVSLTTMTRMVEEERVQIGTMKALGYGKAAIMSKYILYALSASLIGGVAGALIGGKGLPFIVVTAYKMMYQNLIGLELPYVLSYNLLAIGLAVGCTTIATFSACWRELLANPASLMRPAAPKQGKRILLEYIGPLWRHLNFNTKSTIRNLLRYKKRIFMTVFGIGASMGLMLVGFGLRDSLTAIIDNQYDTVWIYNAYVSTDKNAEDEEKKELEDYLQSKKAEISDSLDVYVKSCDFMTTGTAYSGSLTVVSEPDRIENFTSLHDRLTKEVFPLQDDGVIITQKLATLLGVEAGDIIYLKEDDTKAYALKVTAVAEHYLQHYVYMTPAYYETVFGESPEWNRKELIFTEQGLENEEQLSTELLEIDCVQSIQLTSGLAKTVRNMLHSLDLVVVVLIISAGLLAYVVLYNLNNINIAERRRELATLKVLGFYDGEVAMYVYRENIILTFLGVIAGIFIGAALHAYLIHTVEIDAMFFGRDIHTISYVISAALTVTFALIVNVAMYYHLQKIDMVESLKSVE